MAQHNKTSYLQNGQQELLVDHTIDSWKVMAQGIMMNWSEIRTPIQPARNSQVEVHGYGNTVDLQGHK